MLITFIAFVPCVRLISNMHRSIAFDDCFHLIYFSYLLTSAKFDFYEVIQIYDVIALVNKCKILKIVAYFASPYQFH